MFIKEQNWIKEGIASLEVIKPFSVLDIGSQTLEYRTIKQPYLGELYDEIKIGEGNINTLDMDVSSKADFVLDISGPNFPRIGKFDLVLACNILEHIRREQFGVAISNIKNLADKFLIVTSPLYYTWHFQPIDNSFRFTPEEIADLFEPDFKVLKAKSWEDEHYSNRYVSQPKPWVSGVLMERINKGH